MNYRDLNIQTQREAPNNARAEGFSFLVRAGYLTRENIPTSLGELMLNHLRNLSNEPSFPSQLSLSTIGNDDEIFFPISSGPVEVAHCPSVSIQNDLNWPVSQKPRCHEKMNFHLKKC